MAMTPYSRSGRCDPSSRSLTWERPRAARAGAAIISAATLLACGANADASSDGRDAAAARPLPPAIIAPLGATYRALPAVPDAGTIVGTVGIEGVAPVDTTVRPTADTAICGTSFVDTTIRTRGEGVGDVVVWLVGVESGTQVPLRKRYELEASRCRWEPRVQAVLATGTVNVKSADALVHETRMLDARTGETLALVQHNDFGSLVPVQDPIAEARLIEVRGDRHQWMRAWIAVFDHPYFAVTEPAGTFTLADVPAGRYEIRAWHERFGVLVDSVDVTAGAQAALSLRLRPAAVDTGSSAGGTGP